MVPKVSRDQSGSMINSWPVIWTKYLDLQASVLKGADPKRKKQKQKKQKKNEQGNDLPMALDMNTLLQLQEAEEKQETPSRQVNEAVDVKTMSAMEIIELIQTNPELGDVINDFLQKKDEESSKHETISTDSPKAKRHRRRSTSAKKSSSSAKISRHRAHSSVLGAFGHRF